MVLFFGRNRFLNVASMPSSSSPHALFCASPEVPCFSGLAMSNIGAFIFSKHPHDLATASWRKQGTELAIGYLGVKKKCHYYVLKGRYVHVIVVSWLSRVYGICTLYVRTVGGYLWFMHTHMHSSFAH